MIWFVVNGTPPISAKTIVTFVTPSVLNVLIEKFNIKPITTADADIAAILGTAV